MNDTVKYWFSSGGWITTLVQAGILAAVLYLLAKEKEILAQQFMPRIEYEGRHADFVSHMMRIEQQQMDMIKRQDELLQKVTEAYTMIRIHSTVTP